MVWLLGADEHQFRHHGVPRCVSEGRLRRDLRGANHEPIFQPKRVDSVGDDLPDGRIRNKAIREMTTQGLIQMERQMQVSHEEQQMLYSLRGLTSSGLHATLRIEVRAGKVQMIEESKRILSKS